MNVELLSCFLATTSTRSLVDQEPRVGQRIFSDFEQFRAPLVDADVARGNSRSLTRRTDQADPPLAVVVAAKDKMQLERLRGSTFDDATRAGRPDKRLECSGLLPASGSESVANLKAILGTSVVRRICERAGHIL